MDERPGRLWLEQIITINVQIPFNEIGELYDTSADTDALTRERHNLMLLCYEGMWTRKNSSEETLQRFRPRPQRVQE
ncbi:hypothetical protein LguiB_009889 [Lonicera macranthoides]